MSNEFDIIQRLVVNESLRLKPYRCTEGKLTIGVGRCVDTNPLTDEEVCYIGHNCREKSRTEEQAIYLLKHDVEGVKNKLDKRLPWWRKLDEERQYVLIDMCFQLGINGLLKFKNMLAAMDAGDFEKASIECLNSAYARQTPARAKRIARLIKTGEWKI